MYTIWRDRENGYELSTFWNLQAHALSKLEEADEHRKHALDSVEKLRAELYATKMELDRQKTRLKDDHGLLSAENEDLQTKIEELKVRAIST